jgi:hypothetical protein
MEYAVEMGSGAMTYTSIFSEIGSGIQKFVGGIHRHTDIKAAWRSHQLTFMFSD